MALMFAGCIPEKTQGIPDEVAPGIYHIKASRSNIYLIKGKTLILIDTGMKGDGGSVLDALCVLGHRPSDVSHILITHGHIDHTGSLAQLKRETGAQVVAGAADRDFIEGRRKTASMGREGFGGKLFNIALYLMETIFFRYEPARVDTALTEDTELNLSDITVQALATPGHSPGSFSFYLADKKVLFTGDALSGDPSFRLPPRPGCANYAQALASVAKLAGLSFDTCCFGHGKTLHGNADKLIEKLIKK